MAKAAAAKGKTNAKVKTPGKPGRPSRYSEALVKAFCARLRLGRSVMEVCEDYDMPCESTIFDWLAKKPKFSEEYVRACEGREDFFAEEDIGLEKDVFAHRIKHDDFTAVMRNRWRRREQLARKKYGKHVQLDANVNMTLANALDDLES